MQQQRGYPHCRGSEAQTSRAIEHSRGIVGPLVGAGVKVGARMLRKVVELSVSLMASGRKTRIFSKGKQIGECNISQYDA